MKQIFEFDEKDLKYIKSHMKKERLGTKYRGEITNQSSVEEAVRIANITLKYSCPNDLLNLGITKQ